MNVMKFLIDNARDDAQGLRESHSPARDEIDHDALRSAKRLDAAADLAEHSLRALGLLGEPRHHDDDGA